MKELVKKLNDYAYRYYVLNEPIVSDKEYDELYDRLLTMEQNTGITLKDSPTLRVGGEPVLAFGVHTHLSRLWSLDKAKDADALKEWNARVFRGMAQLSIEERPKYVLEYKFDGITINLTYDNGALAQAASRGNGVTGEVILEQVKTIKSIPLSIPFKGRMEVQGEAIMLLSVLQEYNKTAQEPLKNARNAAAGALRNLDPKVTASRRLDAFFYSVGYIEGKRFETHMESIEFLRQNRFSVSPYIEEFDTIEEVIARAKEKEETRSTLDFLIDGMVIKLSRMDIREKLGYTDKFPRWAIAYKFEPEEATTTLNGVLWEVSRTGRVCPTGLLSPVDIGGVQVKRATLNNWGDIQKKKLALHKRVWIRRSNDVIPEIIAAVEEEGDYIPIEKPTVCPSCKSVVEEVGANLFCTNTLSCPPQLVARIVHFASRDAMDIEGLSDKTAQALFDALNVKEMADLYTLTKEQLLTVEGFKEKKSQKLLDEIERSKSCELKNFIVALGIPNVGKKTAEDLAKQYKTFERIASATHDELITLQDVGDIMAKGIVHFFQDETICASINRLLSLGVSPRPYDDKKGIFTGMNVVLTGSLQHFTRNEATDIIEAGGGVVSSSVGRKTSLVIAGEKAGSKLTKARELGVTVIDEEQFKEMLL